MTPCANLCQPRAQVGTANAMISKPCSNRANRANLQRAYARDDPTGRCGLFHTRVRLARLARLEHCFRINRLPVLTSTLGRHRLAHG